MSRFSSELRALPVATKPGEPSTGIPVDTSTTPSSDWKAALPSKLKTTLHERTKAFDKLVHDYASGVKTHDLSHLVRGCMAHRERLVLNEILAHEPIKHLSIVGPVDAQEWTTLVDALPDGFGVERLTLSNLNVDDATVEPLFKALGKMPELGFLVLNEVETDAGLTRAVRNSDLKKLKVLNVTEAGFGQSGIQAKEKRSVCPLLVEILEVSQPRRLTVRGLRFEHSMPRVVRTLPDGPVVTAHQKAALARALGRQTELEMLNLRNCGAGLRLLMAGLPVQLLPGLRMLVLDGNELDAQSTTTILHALADPSCLIRHLSLNGNFIDPKTIAAVALLVKRSRTIVTVSFDNAKQDVHGNVSEFLLEETHLTQLTDALSNNTSLRQLRFRAGPNLDASFLKGLLDHNRQVARVAAARAGMRVVLRGQGHRVPDEVIRYAGQVAAGAGQVDAILSERDTFNISSVNRESVQLKQNFFDELFTQGRPN